MSLRKLRFFNLTVIFMVFLCIECDAKLTENRTKINEIYPDIKTTPMATRRVRIQSPDGPATLFAEELKQTLERYLFGICPPTFKSQFSRGKNTTTCDVDPEQQDLAGRLATLSLRVHSAARADCSRLGGALASTLGELARTAASRHAITAGAAADAANKKRKLSKSQKAKIQAKQRTALAVKKKAAAIAAKTAATSS